jgi:hypothetical protein
MRSLLAFLFLLTISFEQVKASDLSVKAYKVMMAGDKNAVDLTRTFVNGLGSGMEWANATATLKKAPLFCQPAHLALTEENYIDILNAQIDKRAKVKTAAELENEQIEMLLLFGLEETFPCSAK